ncbi:hypothetical protein LDL36_17225 [Komagataeibacter sp. FNDCR1]|nr:hypothetical protein [Gluconobacter potus]MCE2580209.1 hypothetical protein [Komagataeibacter sp. FNDCR1]
MFPQIDVGFIVTDERIREYGLPAPKTAGAGASDLRAFNILERDATDPTGWRIREAGAEELVAPAGEVTFLDTGLMIHIGTPGVLGLVAPRSGSGVAGFCLANTVGYIDSDYTGRLVLAVRPDTTQHIKPGERVAQIAYVPALMPRPQEYTTFAETERGIGGYGSTGKSG